MGVSVPGLEGVPGTPPALATDGSWTAAQGGAGQGCLLSVVLNQAPLVSANPKTLGLSLLRM